MVTRAHVVVQDALLTSQTSTSGVHRHLNGFVGEGAGQSRSKQYAHGVAMSLLRLIPSDSDQEGRRMAARPPAAPSVLEQENGQSGYQHTIFNPGAVSELAPLDKPTQQQEEASPPLRRQLRKRLSLAHYDNMLLYQYFGQQLEDLGSLISRIEKSVVEIR